MTVWAWVAMGLFAAVVLPLLLGLALARIFGGIPADLWAIAEHERWSRAPLTRALALQEEGLEALDLERSAWWRSRTVER